MTGAARTSTGWIAAQESPQPAVGEGVEEIGGVEIRLAITLARKRQHGVGAGFNAAVNQARKCTPRKGKAGSGTGYIRLRTSSWRSGRIL